MVDLKCDSVFYIRSFDESLKDQILWHVSHGKYVYTQHQRITRRSIHSKWHTDNLAQFVLSNNWCIIQNNFNFLRMFHMESMFTLNIREANPYQSHCFW